MAIVDQSTSFRDWHLNVHSQQNLPLVEQKAVRQQCAHPYRLAVRSPIQETAARLSLRAATALAGLIHSGRELTGAA